MNTGGSVPFDQVAIDYSHSQQPVPRGFPLFKRCEMAGDQLQCGQTGATRYWP